MIDFSDPYTVLLIRYLFVLNKHAPSLYLMFDNIVTHEGLLSIHWSREPDIEQMESTAIAWEMLGETSAMIVHTIKQREHDEQDA